MDPNQQVVEATMERIPPGGGRRTLKHAAEYLNIGVSPREHMKNQWEQKGGERKARRASRR